MFLFSICTINCGHSQTPVAEICCVRWAISAKYLLDSKTLFIFFNLLFLAALHFCCCAWAFFSCWGWGILSICCLQASHCSGFSCWKAWGLGCKSFHNCGLRTQLPCSMWNLPWQELNLCPLHWQADSQPLDHQGSLTLYFKNVTYLIINPYVDYMLNILDISYTHWIIFWIYPLKKIYYEKTFHFNFL